MKKLYINDPQCLFSLCQSWSNQQSFPSMNVQFRGIVSLVRIIDDLIQLINYLIWTKYFKIINFNNLKKIYNSLTSIQYNEKRVGFNWV